MDRNNVLKPCPLCASERIKAHYIRDGESLGCQDCGCSVRAYQPDAGDKNIAAWNTRADPVPAILTQSHKALGALLSADIVDPTNEKLVEAWSAYKAGEEYLSGATDEVVSVLEDLLSENEFIRASGIGQARNLLSRLSRAGDE